MCLLVNPLSCAWPLSAHTLIMLSLWDMCGRSLSIMWRASRLKAEIVPLSSLSLVQNILLDLVCSMPLPSDPLNNSSSNWYMFPSSASSSSGISSISGSTNVTLLLLVMVNLRLERSKNVLVDTMHQSKWITGNDPWPTTTFLRGILHKVGSIWLHLRLEQV